MSDESEFGRGVAICLAKFSEHLGDSGIYSERMINEFAEWTPEKQAHCETEAARYPHGDAAQKLARMSVATLSSGDQDRAATLSHMIEMWMNAASDHFYDLDESAPAPLKELAELTLEIGHGFTGKRWTLHHVKKIRDLWELSCIAVDERLGVKDADWGSW